MPKRVRFRDGSRNPTYSCMDDPLQHPASASRGVPETQMISPLRKAPRVLRAVKSSSRKGS